MKSQKIKIDFVHSCDMDSDTGLNPGGRKWNMRFYNHVSTHEMMGDSYVVTAAFLIGIAICIQWGLFTVLGLWWLLIQIICALIITYFIIVQNIKYKARVNRFAIRMNKKYNVPIEQAIEYWEKNKEYLS